jgi:hypothetical protein
MFLPAFSICSCLPPSVDRCFSTSTALPTQGFVPVLSEWKNQPPHPPSGCAQSFVSSPFCTPACRFGCLLPLLSRFSYLFTVVDKTTRWVEAFLLSFGAAAICAAALLQGWIQWFGVLSTITIDRGPQFTSQLWERLHLCLKDALRARSAVANWRSHMPWVILGIRTTWREDAEFLPAENVFGSQLVLPGQFLSTPESPSLSFLSNFQGLLAGRVPLPTVHNMLPTGPVSLPEDLLLSRFVLFHQDGIQPPLSPLYTGPFLVLERSLHFFKLQVGDKVHSVSCLCLKACNTPDDTAVAVLPKRSRPPTAPKLPATDSAPRLRRVSFAWLPAQAHKLTPLPPLFHPSGHPARTVKQPERYS